MSNKRVIIIGAGMGGLSAAVHAQKQGFDVDLFESQPRAGGWCTNWKRGPYYIDAALHHLAGVSKNSPLYPLWKTLGVFPALKNIERDHLVQIEDTDGTRFTAYTDSKRLYEHMLSIAPEDEEHIKKYISAIKQFKNFEMLALPAKGRMAFLSVLPKLPLLMKWGKISVNDFALGFKNSFLKKAFPHIQYDLENIPMLIHLNFMAGMSSGTISWPKGGAEAISQKIVETAENGGVKIHYRSPVRSIIVENNTACGVVLEDGSQLRSDAVIAAVDGYTTIYRFLDGKYTDKTIDSFYAHVDDRQDMNCHVSFGVNNAMENEPSSLAFFLKKPRVILGKERDRITVEIYNFDPSFAPSGKTVIKALFDSSYSEWKKLYDESREKYNAEKKKTADLVLECLEERFAGISSQTEVSDVATPLTAERYTGNRNGTQASIPRGKDMSMFSGGWCQRLPGLARFYMAGQWAGGLGISTCALSGRTAVKNLKSDF